MLRRFVVRIRDIVKFLREREDVMEGRGTSLYFWVAMYDELMMLKGRYLRMFNDSDEELNCQRQVITSCGILREIIEDGNTYRVDELMELLRNVEAWYERAV